jgi:hypothetical protein
MTFAEMIAGLSTSKFPLTNDLVRQATEKRQAEINDALVGMIGRVMERVEAVVKMKVSQLRDCRKLEKQLKSQLDEINKAVAYLNESSNPYPLMKSVGSSTTDLSFALGIDHPGKDSDLWKILTPIPTNAKMDDATNQDGDGVCGCGDIGCDICDQ